MTEGSVRSPGASTERVDDGENQSEDRLIEWYHVHLPKLESLGLIAWDEDARVITRGPNYEDVRSFILPIMDWSDERPERWL